MDPLVRYYLHKAGRGRSDKIIGPYTVINLSYNAIMESTVFRWVVAFVERPLLWHGAKAIGSKAIVTGQNIRIYTVQNTNCNTKIRDIIRRNMTESGHRIIKKLSYVRYKGRKAKRH